MARRLLFSKISLFLALFIGYLVLVDQLNDRFSIGHIKKIPLKEQNIASSLELISLLNQKFVYLGKGSQTYIFLGDDDKTILKLFRFNRFKPSIFSKKSGVKQHKLDLFLDSCEIAASVLSKECGLLTTHFEKSSDLPEITLIDKVQRSHLVDLNNTYFLLQKKGVLLYPFLLECKKEKDLTRAQKAVAKLISLIALRHAKGIHDDDLVITKNVAFIDDEPIFIDIGAFERMSAPIDFLKIFAKAEGWVEANYPEFLAVLREELKKIP